MTFKVGDKVRCVEPSSFGHHPYRNNIYEVTSIRRAADGRTLLSLSTGCGRPVGEWYSSRFVLEQTTKPHKWAKEIKAWADGAQIEVSPISSNLWRDCHSPIWNDTYVNFRIKPEKKPDVYRWYFMDQAGVRHDPAAANLQCTFDGETGKLKKVELL